MSVHDKDNSILKTCGTLTHFEFGFKVFKDEDLIVSLMNPETQELTALTLNEDYTVSISRINDGGAIELTETHEGYSLYAYRNIEIIQPHDIPTEGYFPESTIENALDRGIMIDQQQQEHLDRCIAIPGTSSFLGVNVLLPVPKPGNTLAWSEDGKSLENFDVKGANDEFKSDVNNSITEIRSDMSSFKSDVNNSITDFKTDVDNKIIEVSEAATKINELENAVQTATNSATIAKEQAGIATQKANEAIALNPADRDLSNLTEAGKEAIRKNSGGTLPLGWSDYQKGVTPSSAFLASLGQQNSGTFYPTFYNKFSAKIGQAFGAGFVKAHTASDITDYDLVINPDEQTFRLPLKNGKENLVGDEYIQISTLPANDETLTAPANGHYTISVFASATTSRFYMTNLSNNLTVGEGGATLSNVSWNYVMPCKKGDKIQFHYESVTILNGIFYFCPNIGNGTLYYKVSNAVQNLQLLDVAEMTTALAKKVDSTNTQWAVSACMPDYSAGKNVSSATIHTATVDGYVFAQAQSTSGGNGGHVDIYDKNGTLIKSWNYVGAENTQTYSYSAFMCPIPKGYSYNVHGGINIVIQFYPAKGTEV